MTSFQVNPNGFFSTLIIYGDPRKESKHCQILKISIGFMGIRELVRESKESNARLLL